MLLLKYYVVIYIAISETKIRTIWIMNVRISKEYIFRAQLPPPLFFIANWTEFLSIVFL